MEFQKEGRKEGRRRKEGTERTGKEGKEAVVICHTLGQKTC